jgi:hypothetical protein
MSPEYITITGCTIGDDSASGKAVSVTFEEGRRWVPYSLINKIKRTKNKMQDEITVAYWWAEKEGIANGD